MRALTMPRMLATLAALGGLALALRTVELKLDRPAPAEADARFAARREPSASSSTEPPPASEAPATAKLRELRAMSETFRNTTFLIGIRNAGFLCHELLGVYGGVNNSMTWTAKCSDMLAYTVGVAESGALTIEPLLEHWDALPFTPPLGPGGRQPLPLERR